MGLGETIAPADGLTVQLAAILAASAGIASGDAISVAQALQAAIAEAIASAPMRELGFWYAYRGHDTKVAPVSGSSEQNEKNSPLSRPSIKPSAIALSSRVWLTPPGHPEDLGFPDLCGCRTLNSLSCPDPQLTAPARPPAGLRDRRRGIAFRAWRSSLPGTSTWRRCGGICGAPSWPRGPLVKGNQENLQRLADDILSPGGCVLTSLKSVMTLLYAVRRTSRFHHHSEPRPLYQGALARPCSPARAFDGGGSPSHP